MAGCSSWQPCGVRHCERVTEMNSGLRIELTTHVASQPPDVEMSVIEEGF
jgi:hypothetical protein